jgi:hypothetical protein
MYFDPLYLLILLPCLIISGWASLRVRSTFRKYSELGIRSGLSGAEVAERILSDNGINDVRVEAVGGFLSDHYDPRNKVLRLSPDVYEGRSMASLGVAAHEVGHAVQHAQGYAPLQFRSALVPIASIGSNLSWILFFIGMAMSVASPLGKGFIIAGIGLFSLAVLFTLVTLPVEFDASRRALVALEHGGYMSAVEVDGARSVLRAAAMTYVAAAITAIAQLVYLLIRSGLLGSRDDS